MMSKLTENELNVLGELASNSKATDLEIGDKLGLSGSSIARIRERLQEKGIIKKYCIDIDFSTLGIECYVIVFYMATDKWWREIDDEDVKKILSSPYIISAYRLPERRTSYITLYGFKDVKCATTYLNELQRVYNDYLMVEKAIFLSPDNILKNCPSGLLKTLNVPSEETKPNKKLFDKLKKI